MRLEELEIRKVKICPDHSWDQLEYCYVSLWPIKRQHVIYITIYIHFLDGRLCEVGAIRRGIKIVRLWGLDPSVLDDGRGNAHGVTTGQACVNSEIFLSLPFNSSALYFHQTPTWRYGHASTPTQSLPITGQWNMQLPPSLEWHVWSSSSGNNCHAVHRSPSSGASVCDCTVGF